jgi:DNA-binding MarR family transcriptional regulator
VRLAAEERLQPQSLTRLLATLERQGLISRTPGPNDRRERVIALTRHGRDMLASGLRDRGRWLEAAMADTLTDREQAALLDATNAMIKLANYAAPSSVEEKGPGGKRSSHRDER